MDRGDRLERSRLGDDGLANDVEVGSTTRRRREQSEQVHARLLGLLDDLEALIEKGARIPFSSMVLIDRDVYLDSVDAIRISMPEAVVQAERIVRDKERIIAQAEAEAERVVSLAKEREELFLPGTSEPLVLPRTSQSLYLVQRVRDEAHRFALAYHHRVRRKKTFESVLDGIPGIGPKRRRALLKRFGGVKAIREAAIEEIAAVPGMTLSAAQKLKEHI